MDNVRNMLTPEQFTAFEVEYRRANDPHLLQGQAAEYLAAFLSPRQVKILAEWLAQPLFQKFLAIEQGAMLLSDEPEYQAFVEGLNFDNPATAQRRDQIFTLLDSSGQTEWARNSLALVSKLSLIAIAKVANRPEMISDQVLTQVMLNTWQARESALSAYLISWAFMLRSDSDQLLQELNAFFRQEGGRIFAQHMVRANLRATTAGLEVLQ